MATKSETADIAVLQTQMAGVVLDIGDIKADTKSIVSSLASLPEGFVTRGEFSEFKKRWLLSHTMAGIVPSVLTGLVIYFLTHGAK